MCHAQPGRRCASDLKKKISKAKSDVEKFSDAYDKSSSPSDLKKMYRARSLHSALQREFVETPEGQMLIKQKMVDNGGTNKDLTRALVDGIATSGMRKIYESATTPDKETGEIASDVDVYKSDDTTCLRTSDFSDSGIIESSEIYFAEGQKGTNMRIEEGSSVEVTALPSEAESYVAHIEKVGRPKISFTFGENGRDGNLSIKNKTAGNVHLGIEPDTSNKDFMDKKKPTPVIIKVEEGQKRELNWIEKRGVDRVMSRLGFGEVSYK